MEGLSQELITIIAAAIAVAAVVVPGVRALRSEIGELRQQMVAVDQRLSDEVGALRSEFRSDLGVFREEIRSELNSFREEVRADLGEVRNDLGEVRNELGELRERMARVEGLFEGFTRSEPALGTGSA